MESNGKIKEALEKLKLDHKGSITAKKINGKLYVYSATTRWDKARKKAKTETRYLGKLTEDGRFIEKRSVHKKQTAAYAPNTIKEKAIDPIDEKLIVALSTDARTKLSALGDKLGLTRSATYNRVKLLESNYGIRYTAEVDPTKLGFFPFLLLVKFRHKVPSSKEIMEFVEKEPRIQLVMRTEGEFDMIAYILARTNTEIATMRREFRLALSSYNSKWEVSTTELHFGYIPLREEFIELIKGDMLKREYAVLKELVKDGSTEFTTIDNNYGFEKGRALYTYHKLLKSGIIKRITITIGELPIKYTGILFQTIVNYGKFDKSRMGSYLDMIEPTKTLTNKYIYICSVEEIGGSVFLFPVFKDGDMDRIKHEHLKARRGIEVHTGVVTHTIIGSLCFRKIDVTETYQYKRLTSSEFGLNPEQII